MPTKKVTGGYVTVSKAGKVGTKVFTTKANAEKVQRAARKNLGKTRGGKAKATPKATPKGTGSTGGGNPTTDSSKKPMRMGAAYQVGKVTGQAAVPLTDYALQEQPKTVDGLMAHLKGVANPELAKGYAVAGADAALSKSRLVGHAGALSRRSATAIAPEAYLAVKGFEDAAVEKVPARTVHGRAAKRTMGYDPLQAGGKFVPADPEFRTYHKIKWIGAGVRAIANRTRLGKRVFAPVKRVLSMLGGAL